MEIHLSMPYEKEREAGLFSFRNFIQDTPRKHQRITTNTISGKT